MNTTDAKRAAIIWLGLRLSPVIDRALSRWSKLDDQPVIDPELFDWVPELEENWTMVRHELDQVLDDKSALPPMRLISRGWTELRILRRNESALKSRLAGEEEK